MELKLLPPKKILDKAFQKQRPLRSEMEGFKSHLNTLLSKVNEIESEENQKNYLRDFLLSTYYAGKYEVNTKENKDLVIHLGKTNADAVGVVVEAKKPSNKAEMISEQNANRKALHELILYYFDEREQHGNTEQKQLIITNIYQWYIFDANTFDQHIYKNTALKKLYKNYKNDKKTTDFFYTEAEKIITKSNTELECAYFDIRGYEKLLTSDKKDDIKRLIALFKILSPQHLLKLPVANDSNALNEKFYRELLHIIGLEEHKEGSKTIIRRLEKNRQSGSLIEMVVSMLETKNSLRKVPNLSEYGEDKKEQLFTVALQLCITWVNRLLFLKLLEAQLKDYHSGDDGYTFLNIETIPDFDELFKLFHNVLAKPIANRTAEIQNKYSKVPYLNSSLFDFSDIEDATITVNDLDDNAAPIEFYSHTKLKTQKKSQKGLQALAYIFTFLDAYDFAGETGEDIQEDENHQLINASVLGKVFEKINGYKDGSIYTPGFITMYMCRQAIRPAVVQKFNEAYGWQVEEFDHLYNHLNNRRSPKDILADNALINSLHICDPAVGSGHFLVSALNELIAIKYELGILADENGKTFGNYDLEIANDELIITDSDDEFFSYHMANGKPAHKESQRLQETLFKEKQTLIENCLFGVDINPNSVKICRLRLWIELLKNAYYKPSTGAGYSHAEFNSVSAGRKGGSYTELETLPNIDINIKCGNSLLSRFALDADLKAAFSKKKFNLQTYRDTVEAYHKSRNREEKEELTDLITNIKKEYSQAIYSTDPRRKKLSEIRGQLALVQNNFDLFGKKMDENKRKLEERRLTLLLEQKEKELEEAESGALYRNAFEWRFEFPEVLNDKGDYIGFDVVIGNPPYFSVSNDTALKRIRANYKSYSSTGDIYALFYELSINIISEDKYLSLIVSNKWMRANYGESLRSYIVNYSNPLEIVDFGQNLVFDNAIVHACILFSQKNSFQKTLSGVRFPDNYHHFNNSSVTNYIDNNLINNVKVDASIWNILTSEMSNIQQKIEYENKRVRDWNVEIYRGILTGYNDAFIIDGEIKEQLIKEDSNNSNIIKPILRGRDTRRYYCNFADLYIINSHNGYGVEPRIDVVKDFPSIYKYLQGYEEKAKKRYDKGKHWTNLRNCAYLDEFSKPKIIYSEIVSEPQFYYDEEGYYPEATVFFIVGEKLKYLIGLLNSKPVTFFFENFYMGGELVGKIRYKKVFLEEVPIPIPNDKQEKGILDVVDKILSAKKENPAADTTAWEAEIDQLVYQLYNLTPEEIAIVEGKA